jgi:hypothetical protein
MALNPVPRRQEAKNMNFFFQRRYRRGPFLQRLERLPWSVTGCGVTQGISATKQNAPTRPSANRYLNGHHPLLSLKPFECSLSHGPVPAYRFHYFPAPVDRALAVLSYVVHP